MQLRLSRQVSLSFCLIGLAASIAIALWVVTGFRSASTLPRRRSPARRRMESITPTMDVQQFDEGLFVSTAYLDARATPPDVKVLAYFRRGRVAGEALVCRFASHVINATYESTSLGARKRTDAWMFGYIRCVVNISPAPSTLTLSNTNGSVSLSLPLRPSMGAATLDDRSSQSLSSPPRGFFLCTKSLYGSVDALRLIEWIELYLLLGVRHLYVYSYGINADAQRALERYASLGTVTLVLDNALSQMERAQPQFKPLFAQRNLEHATGEEPFMQHQLISVHDCLYRYGAAYEYMIVCDTDEVFVPSAVRTLPELATLARGIAPRATTFTLYSAQYLPEFESEAGATACSSSNNGSRSEELLHMLRYTRHGDVTRDLHKSFHSTGDTLLVGQHDRSRPAGRKAQVPADVAWVHHYRNACKHKWCAPDVRFTDDGCALMARYADELSSNVRLAASELGLHLTLQ